MPTETVEAVERRLPRGRVVAYQRLATLGSLAAAAAHEFNNLMTPVLARAQHALRTGDPQAARRALECTVQQTERAMAITRRLLALADEDEPAAASCRLAEAVQNAFTAIARPLDKDGIDLTVRVPQSLQIRAEPILFEQLLVNLLLNARNAMRPSGGRITLEAWPDEKTVVLEVRDTGHGMPEEQLQVVQPFLAGRGDPPIDAWRCVGLGLYTCRIIAQHFRATIDVFNNNDGGCTFRLRWPVAS